MDQKKLQALRNKYQDQQMDEVDDPEFKRSLIGLNDLSSGIATLLDAPYQKPG